MPSLMHHTANRDNPASAWVAKGAPLGAAVFHQAGYSRFAVAP